MVDPLSALSVAAATVQFVDYSTKVAAKAREIAAKGSTTANDEIEKTTFRLRRLSESVSQHSGSGREQTWDSEQNLRWIASESCEVANEMIALLDQLKSREPRNVFWSIKNAYKAEHKQEKISKMQARLERLQAEMSQELLLVLRHGYLIPDL